MDEVPDCDARSPREKLGSPRGRGLVAEALQFAAARAGRQNGSPRCDGPDPED